uniref:Fumarate lyase N-terminal domain-containing protein n=1 Tax=Ditylenchus dipsaci TaxID=166011 RepID=A0A915CZK7_9BILA
MLAETQIISEEDSLKIINGLSEIQKEIEAGKFQFSDDLEDIHMNIESGLSQLIGAESAGRLHTARSRNDQVATDLKLWTKKAFKTAFEAVQELVVVLLDMARQHTNTIMPGFTHLQCAQPVTFAHHCMAYVEMLGKDLSRIEDAIKRMDECPLGAG